jgi:hypothetical protein
VQISPPSPLGILVLVFAAFSNSANDDRVRVAGTYANPDYGFSVRLPHGYSGWRGAGTSSNHGFQLVLPECPAAQVWVYAGYNATFLPSLDAIAEDQFRRPSSPARLMKRHVWVAGVSALEVSEAGRMAVILFRSVPGGVGIIYTLSIEGADAEKRDCMGVFRDLVRGFRLRFIAVD